MAGQQTQPAAAVGNGTVSPKTATSSSPANALDLELLPEDGEDLEADSEVDCGESVHSGSESLRSSIITGIVEHGRRYQGSRNNDVNMPSDERQFLSMEAAHQAYTVLECQQENPYFRSRLSPEAQYVLDVGTGSGDWPIAVADAFPNLTVYGVDLYPPPQTWVPPNCFFEVDDATRPWTWSHKFDLVHMRILVAALPKLEFERLYQRAYDNLSPGGWIEHVDLAAPILCDDGSLPQDSLLAGYGEVTSSCVANTENTIDVIDIMRAGIEKAGFINVHERTFKFPLGDWARHPVYKEAGARNVLQFKEGLQGWVMWALTKFGAPEPWSEEQVMVYVSKMRQELDKNYHIYQMNRRVWAQKPWDALRSEE